jgi:hypothetical protein
MYGKLLKRNSKWLVEFISNMGAPSLLPLYPKDELDLSLRSEFKMNDLNGFEVEFEIVEYNKKGSAYNNCPYPTYAKLSPYNSPSIMIDKLKQHLASITPEQFQEEIKEIEDEGFVGGVTMGEFICNMPDCPHCAYEEQQQYEEDLEKEAAVDFLKWIENKYSFGNVLGYWYKHSDSSKYTAEELYNVYLKDINEI